MAGCLPVTLQYIFYFCYEKKSVDDEGMREREQATATHAIRIETKETIGLCDLSNSTKNFRRKKNR
jgi:hypothetical protein